MGDALRLLHVAGSEMSQYLTYAYHYCVYVAQS